MMSTRSAMKPTGADGTAATKRKKMKKVDRRVKSSHPLIAGIVHSAFNMVVTVAISAVVLGCLIAAKQFT